MFGIISDAIDKAKALDANEGLSFVLRIPQNKELIPDLIQEQLYSGISGDGKTLKSIGGDYTTFTKSDKRRRGLPYNVVTLFQTGVFYQSIVVTIEKDGWTVEFDPIKGGKDLRKRWGDEIMDLTDESMVELIDQIVPFYVEWLINELTG